MTLRHLLIFIAVVDSGSMTAAAEALFVAQPTVSQAIADLEKYYGIKLFDRLSRRLYITEAGKSLLSYARHITALFNEMEQALKNTDKIGIIRIGASMTVATCLLPSLINQFTATYPSIHIKAVAKNTKDIETLVSKNELDFAVVEGVVHTPDILSTAFMDDELVLICGRDHPLYQVERISLGELSEYGFLVRERGSGTRELFENTMAAYGAKWQLAWDCNGSECLKSAAISGMGVAVISQMLVADEVQAGDLWLMQVDGFQLKRQFSVIRHKNKFFTESMQAFTEMCYAMGAGHQASAAATRPAPRTRV